MKKWISLLLGTALALQCTAFVAPGADPAVERFQEQGILVGDETGDLRLDQPITRAEFSRLVWETGLVQESGEQEKTFTDVSASHWGYAFISRMAASGLLCGDPEGTFRPEDSITLLEAERIGLRILNNGDPMLNLSVVDCAARAIDSNLLLNVTALQEEAITRKDAVCLLYQVMEEKKEQEISDDFVFSAPLAGYGAAGGGGTNSFSGGMTMETSEDGGSSSASSAVMGGCYAPIPMPYVPVEEPFGEDYASVEEGGFHSPSLSPLSTFSIDTDTASYSNMRRFLLSGQIPPKGSVRIEELINYFDYETLPPQDGAPFGVTTEVGECPWNREHLLARISIQGEELSRQQRQPQNLVFLIDVSGSMYSKNKLPLVKKSMNLLLEQLDERDSVSLVTYASGTRVVLEGVSGDQKEVIRQAINNLVAGGGTAGADGLALAYRQAEANRKEGNNRIILCTDGDFNIGPSSNAEMKDLVTRYREQNIFISVLGFGIGNYKDSRLEILADNGNGNYYYIDNLKEAKKVLADEMTQTLYTIARDVKIQTEFNPQTVSQYRLVGYENRMLQAEDFENDQKDAGELGAGSSVTALYEIIPGTSDQADLRYQSAEASGSSDLFLLKIRYQQPQGSESRLLEFPVGAQPQEQTSDDFRFAAAVAELGMLLNQSEYSGSASYDQVLSLARGARGEDPFGYRGELISLVDLLKIIDQSVADGESPVVRWND